MQGLSYFKELDDIQATFPSLSLGNVGLRAIELLRKCGLREPCILPRFDQKLTESRVCRRED